MSQSMVEQIEIQSAKESSAIKLQFERSIDRWIHRWVVAIEESDVCLLNSIEGTSEQHWPPSAPLQEVSKHVMNSGDAALCVGMAGNSHWSASYSVETLDDCQCIKADLACLQKSVAPESQMGSAYQLGPQCQVQEFSERRIVIRSDQTSVAIDALVGDSFQTSFALDDRTLQVRPHNISTTAGVATRWGFIVSNT